MLWGKHESELLKVYEEVDGAIGEVRNSAPGAELIVMSDHGFSSYDRSVHLNTWLQRRGFLRIHAGPGNDSGLSAIDWPQTRAYALGLNGLYLNLEGREAHGVVTAAQRETLLNNLREQLLAWRDPVSGRQVIEAVEETRVTTHNANVAPDLIVGYARGYRASWQTGLGGLGPDELEDNTDSWIGDHCINAADVPGVLFTNRPIVAHSPRLEDVTASLLGLFGVSQSAESTGVSLYTR
jgi:predicted AlkP superfamily phosphohydrolase/phosphomutase